MLNNFFEDAQNIIKIRHTKSSSTRDTPYSKVRMEMEAYMVSKDLCRRVSGDIKKICAWWKVNIF